MRENYAGRIYDSGELDQRLDDVQGDEAVVVALMRLVGGGEGCGELCFIWVPKYHSTAAPQHHSTTALCMISLSVIVASLYLLVLLNLT